MVERFLVPLLLLAFFLPASFAAITNTATTTYEDKNGNKYSLASNQVSTSITQCSAAGDCPAQQCKTVACTGGICVYTDTAACAFSFEQYYGIITALAIALILIVAVIFLVSKRKKV